MASIISKNRCFNGVQYVYQHTSSSLKCDMKFGVYVPDHKEGEQLATLFYLSGLTCTHANFMEKSGFQQYASKYRFVVVHPDTSPRGVDIEGDSESWDFGKGAGFYVNATEPKWAKNYQMYDYICKELVQFLLTLAPIDSKRIGIFGHSMGGHGALVIGLRNPETFKSISAFSPICNPSNVPWGKKAFTGYLGNNESTWEQYDASKLVQSATANNWDILVDQGADDNFLPQLCPDTLKSTANAKVNVRLHPGYDHSYYFIATFIGDHFAHHANILGN